MKHYLLPAILLLTGLGLTGCSSTSTTTPPASTPHQLFVGNGYATTPANRGMIFNYALPVASTSTTNFTLTIGTATSALESFTQDATNDYVGDCNNHVVRAFARPLGSASTQAFTLTAATVGPDGLATDSSGNLYATEDCATDHIDVWSAPVTSSSTISVSQSDSTNPARAVQQMYIDNVNHLLYVGNCRNTNQVLQYALPLTATSTASVAVSIAGETCIDGLALDPVTNQLFVASDSFNKIYAFSLPISAASTPTLTITTPTVGRRFQNIAFDSAGNMYASDRGTTTIDIFVPPFTATSDATFTLAPAGIDSPWGLSVMQP